MIITGKPKGQRVGAGNLSSNINAHWVLAVNTRVKLVSEMQKEWKLDGYFGIRINLAKAYSLTPTVKAKKKNISFCKQVHELTYSVQNKWFNQVRQHKVTSAKKD